MRLTKTLTKDTPSNKWCSSPSQFACVVFTDIVAYTALMDEDQELALQILDQNRQMQRGLIYWHGGTCIKEMGDGILATFDSNIAAIQCAKRIQEAAAEIDHLRLRIGIHCGKVVAISRDISE